MENQRKPVRQLNAEVARKIAAGEVIDRPNAIIRELMDNAVDSGATEISVETTGGGIEKIRVVDNGCGMTREDLENCARPHATSKISTETDLLHLSTLGFRGEALSSMAAVSRLEIISNGWKMCASVTEDHVLTPAASASGTIVQTSALFENFPARRQFLKRPASEGTMCRATFEEKVLPRPDIAFNLSMDGEKKLSLPAGQTLTQRFVQTMEFFENESDFHEVTSKAPDGSWSFRLILGSPSVTRSSRKNIFIYVNGRKISEYSLVQAIEYGGQGFFPNGSHPVACLFLEMDPSLVDFNIHPAKREARFKDINAVHHQVSTTARNFYRQYTLETMKSPSSAWGEKTFSESEIPEPDLGLEAPQFTPSSPTERIYSFQRHGSSLSLSRSQNQAQSEDKRSSFFSGTGSGFSGSAYSGGRFPSGGRKTDFSETSAGAMERIGLLVSAASEDRSSEINPGEASVEGHPTKPNYVPDSEDQTEDGFHYVGCALGTFIIAEKGDVLYIIDQHAAHERYIYNQIMEAAGEKQTLLVPYTVTTDSPADDNYLEEISDSLEQAGFTGKNCGNGRWEFSTVPARWKGSEADLGRDLLDRRIRPHDLINSVAASTACRMAVMDGDMLDDKMASWIARLALQLPDPHCPHGRPVYTTITRRQLFTLVKRI